MTIDYASYIQQIHNALMPCFSGIVSKEPRFITYRAFRPIDTFELDRIDVRIQSAIPVAIVELFVKVASKFEFGWAFQEIPADLRTRQVLFTGRLEWDVTTIIDLVKEKETAQEGTVFETEWKDKMPLMSFGNGDYLAVPRDSLGVDEVYYLTPAEPAESVVAFKCGLFEFLLDWCKIGCVSDVSLLQFRDANSGKLSLRGRDAVCWLQWLGVSMPNIK